MADNGKIIRNGAEIQIDENGNVVARPAAGQEFIVEDDARVGTLEADALDVGGQASTYHWDTVEIISEANFENDEHTISDFDTNNPYFIVVNSFTTTNGNDTAHLDLTFGSMNDGDYDYIEATVERSFSTVTGENAFRLCSIETTSNFGKMACHFQDMHNIEDVGLSGRHGGARRISTSNSTFLVSATSNERPQETDDMTFSFSGDAAEPQLDLSIYQRTEGWE